MWRFEEVPFEQMIWKLSPRRGCTGYSYKLMSKMSPYTSNYVVILPYWHQLILLFFLSFWRWRECFIDFLYVLTIFDILLNFFLFSCIDKKLLVRCGICHLMTEIEKPLQRLVVLKPWYGLPFLRTYVIYIWTAILVVSVHSLCVASQ